ncbi:MAG: hypothetical protein R3B70_15375 [Polyangiaceae bacterium]
MSDDPAAVRAAPLVVLPGVGAFAAGMESLTARGLDLAIAERVREGRPLLAVCLGLQLLLDASEEGPGVRGLGVVSGHARRFGDRACAYRSSGGTASSPARGASCCARAA